MSGLVRRAGLVERQRWTRSRGWVLAVVTAMAVTLAPTGPAGAVGAAELGATVAGGVDPLDTAQVTGVVQNSFAEPVPSVHVAVLEAATMASVGSALTDGSGRFTVGDLAAGTYLVAYSKGGFAWQLHDGVPDEAAATPVVLEAGMVAELTATLEWAGGIRGTVTDDAGTPVVGAIVTATGPAGTRSATTTADGTYRMALPPGGYTVAFPTSVGDVSYQPQWWSAATTVDAATMVTVGLAGFEVADAELIRPPSLWRGLVTDVVTGAPVPNVYVSVSNVATGAGALYRGAPDGTFAISGLAEGTYRVWFSAPIATPYAVLEGGDFAVAPGRVTTTDAALEPMMRLSGALVDPFGRPVPGAWVESTRDLDFSRDFDVSDGSWETKSVRGSVYIRGMAPGFVTTWYGGATSADTAVPLVLDTVADRSGLDIVLEWTSGISGVLLAEAGGGAGGVTVTATGAPGTRSTTTAADGTFTLALPAGDYVVSYTGPGYLESWYDGAQALVDATPVTVAPEAYTAIDDVVPAGFGSVSGTVTGLGGEPVVGLRVLITNEVTSEYWIAHTDASGAYRAWGPTPGEYAVYFDTSRLASDYLPQYYDGAVTLDTATLFTVGTSTDVTGVDAVLDPGAAISGTIMDGLSRPAAVHVALVDPASGSTLETAATAADGSYAFTGLRPGDYLVRVLGDGVFVDEFVGGGDDVSTATRVPLALGTQVVVDVTAHWLGGVAGTIQDENGAPAAGVRVDATSPQGVLTGFTAADGTYALDLPADVHQVSVTSTSTDPLYDVLAVPDVTVGTAVVELGVRALTINYGSVSGGIRVRTYWGDEYYVGDAVQVTAWAADSGATPGEFTVTAHGWFTLDGLPPGDYVILAEPIGHYYKAFYGDGDDLATATRVTIGYGEDLTDLDIWVRSLNSVIANVSDPSGADVVGATVELLDRDTGDLVAAGVTGDEGYAYFDNLLPNRYTYRASAPGHLDGYFYASPTFEGSSVLDFTAGGWHGSAFMVLPWAQAVHGTATVAGEPRWVTVRALRASDHTELASAYTDENGQYELGVPADDVILEFSRSGTVTGYSGGATDIAEATVLTLAEGETREGVDADLDWASSISGTVRDETGAPRAGVAVLIDGEPRATTAVDGTYSAPTEPGHHRVSFDPGFPYAFQYFTGVTYQYASPWVEVPLNGERTGVDADLWFLPGRIAGTVVDENGTALAGVTVTATAGESYTAVTDETGVYELELPPGEYLVRFASSSYDPVYRPLWFDDVLDPDAATPVVVDVDATTPDVDAVLQVDAATLTGTVRASAVAGAMGIPGVVMRLWDADTGVVRDAVTDAAGEYSFVGIPPGVYVLRADASSAPPYLSRYFGPDVQDVADAERIWLWWGDAAVADLVLDRTVSVVGEVRDADGAPAPDVRVEVFHAVPWAWAGQATTGADGSFGVDGLEPGSYVVRASGSGLVTEYYADAAARDEATVLALPEGAVAELTIDLAWAQGISGTVVDEDGEPMAGVVVSARSTGPWVTTTTGADGGYVMALPPGDYVVSFRSDSADPVYEELFHDGALDDSEAQPVTVAVDAYTDVDAQMVVAWVVPTFVDVVEGQVFHTEIRWLAERGMATGWPDGTFRPTAPITREALAAFLHRYVDRVLQRVVVVPVFVDVTNGNPFYDDIMWLVSSGIASGWADGTFRPAGLVERQAMAAFLYRLAGGPGFTAPAVSPFVDVQPGDAFYTEICWLLEMGITSGRPTASGLAFEPSVPIERQAMAAFLYRFDAAMDPR